ncbi:MAG: nicotinate phosphoribosyltransferase [Spirochaetia bacterium]|nr:nicotinate phosphoribosyltransferase [Spirochaetia bacterium]MBQ3647872.1 nicotinate phosphoribosyltransferase [Spirochaetia bacterium]MBQ3713856.1 nicotinate phosphoribosyltransferase [Spirochaetia bacterium]
MEQIIKSLLDTDAYKFSMGQAVFHQFSGDHATWTFKCRNDNVKFTKEMVREIRRQVGLYCNLRFTEDELKWLPENNIWIHNNYCDYLRFWHPRKSEIHIDTKAPCGLNIEAKGTWGNTSPYEIPILAIVNEVYFRMAYDYDELFEKFKLKVADIIAKLKDGTYDVGVFSEFGARRRLSFEAQDYLIKALVDARIPGFVGTSNVYLAKKYGIKAVGTLAHEYVMTVGQGHHEYNPAYSNKFAMDTWVKEYGILNGIALTDTITTDCFLQDFQLTFATLFSGVRHDSGDPIAWGEKIIEHYKKLGIDPMTKTLLFSDSLNMEKATRIYQHFKGKAKIAFGIGTYLSGSPVNPLNIVMKVTMVNGQPVAKISDDPSKSICKDSKYVDYLKRCINWRMTHLYYDSEKF